MRIKIGTDMHFNETCRHLLLKKCLSDMDTKMRDNARTRKTEILYPDKCEWIEFDQTEKSALFNFISNNYTYGDMRKPLNFQRNQRLALNNAVGFKETDPFISYVNEVNEQIPKPEYSAHELIQNLFDTLGNNAVRASLSLTLGAIRRSLNPGCNQCEHLVLEGDDGIGKSDLLKYLIPDEMRSYCYYNKIVITPRLYFTRKYARTFVGNLIVEIPEKTGIKDRPYSALKYLTMDGQRVYIGSKLYSVKRRNIFVITSNNAENLREQSDIDGRRFEIVNLRTSETKEYPKEWLTKEVGGGYTIRDHIWASALNIYNQWDFDSTQQYERIEYNEGGLCDIQSKRKNEGTLEESHVDEFRW